MSLVAVRSSDAPVVMAHEVDVGLRTGRDLDGVAGSLTNGPFGSYDVTWTAARAPYGNGSLGIEVADEAARLAERPRKEGRLRQ
ncbi:hypothetical protein [Streptomyces sp. NPDC005046]